MTESPECLEAGRAARDTSPVETVGCNLCGSTESRVLFADTVLRPDGTMGVVRCRECGLVYRNIRRRPSLILESFRGKRHEEISDDWLHGRIRVFTPHARSLEPFRRTGRILDVGAGHGFFLRMCADHGWECHGVEPSTECAAFAAERFGIRYGYPTLDEAAYPESHFDVVTCWNVLDQLPDPKGAVIEMHRVLRPGGLLVVRCPNAAFHVAARRTFRAIARIAPPLRSLDHTVFQIYNFDRRTMTALLAATCFDDVRVSPADLGWTTTHGADPPGAKKLILTSVSTIARVVHTVTAGSVLWAPSLLATAHKTT